MQFLTTLTKRVDGDNYFDFFFLLFFFLLFFVHVGRYYHYKG